jgi:hypothetical protein
MLKVTSIVLWLIIIQINTFTKKKDLGAEHKSVAVLIPNTRQVNL